MNRRKFLRGLAAATVVTPLVTKSLSDKVFINKVPKPGVDFMRTKTVPRAELEDMYPNLSPHGVDADGILTGNEEALGFYGGDQFTLRERHQMEANEWLRKKVDDAAFKMMTGGKI